MQSNRNRSLLPLAVCLFVACGVQTTLAYDGDVDYGAPYVTLQDGKLVTVDPSKQDAQQQGEHPAQSPAKDSQAPAPVAAAGTAVDAPEEGTGGEAATVTAPVWLYMVLIGAVLVFAFIMVRRSRRTGRQDMAEAGTEYSPGKG